MVCCKTVCYITLFSLIFLGLMNFIYLKTPNSITKTEIIINFGVICWLIYCLFIALFFGNIFEPYFTLIIDIFWVNIILSAIIGAFFTFKQIIYYNRTNKIFNEKFKSLINLVNLEKKKIF